MDNEEIISQESASITTTNLENTTKERKAFPVWQILFRNIWLILAITIFCGAIGAVYGFVTKKPTYTASSNVILGISLGGNAEESNTATDVSLSKLYLPTITGIIASPTVVERANNIYKGEGTINLGSVGISYKEGSLIFTMRYHDRNPQLAKAKLRAMVEAGARELNENGADNVPAKEFMLTETQRDFRVSSYHNGTKFVFTGLALGLVFAIIVAFLKYILDNKMKSANELEEITGVNVIAYIDKV